MEILTELSAWHWLIMGAILLICETLGARGYLLGFAVGAFLVAVIMALLPGIAWQSQALCFAVLSSGASYLYLSRFRNIEAQGNKPSSEEC